MLHGRTNDVTPNILKLYGERCSGTNYVETLLKNNFPKLKSRRRYNWEKHNFVNPPYVRDSMLGLVVTRDPFDWLRSLHRNPHQVGYWYKEQDFSGFLRHEWSGVFNGYLLERQGKLNVRMQEIIYERHPITGARIDNVVQLRNLKLQSHLKVRNLYHNWAIVQFEEVRNDPKAFVQNIATEFSLTPAVKFQDVTKDVSNIATAGDPDGNVRKQPYADFSDEDRKFVLDRLDLEQEKHVGYAL